MNLIALVLVLVLVYKVEGLYLYVFIMCITHACQLFPNLNSSRAYVEQTGNRGGY